MFELKFTGWILILSLIDTLVVFNYTKSLLPYLGEKLVEFLLRWYLSKRIRKVMLEEVEV